MDDFSQIRRQSTIHIDKKEWSKAVSLLKQMKQRKPWLQEIYQELIYCFERLGKPGHIYAVLEDAVAANKEASWPYISKARFLAKNEKYKDALETIDDFLLHHPDSLVAALEKVSLYESEKNIHKAYELCEELYQANPFDVHLSICYVSLLIKTDRYDTARFVLERFPEYMADDPTFNYYKALVAENNDEDAVSLYSKVIEFDPYFVQAYNNLGIIYLKKGCLVQSIHTFKRGYDLRASDYHLVQNLAYACFKSSRYDEAKMYYEQCLKVDGDNVACHLNLATTLQIMGLQELALEHFAACRRIGVGNRVYFLEAISYFYRSQWIPCFRSLFQFYRNETMQFTYNISDGLPAGMRPIALSAHRLSSILYRNNREQFYRAKGMSKRNIKRFGP